MVSLLCITGLRVWYRRSRARRNSLETNRLRPYCTTSVTVWVREAEPEIALTVTT